MDTNVPLQSSNRSEENENSFNKVESTDNPEEQGSSLVNLHIISVGSIVCAALFFIIVASYMCYVHWKLHHSQHARRRSSRPRLPVPHGTNTGDYAEPLSITRRQLPPVPTELANMHVYTPLEERRDSRDSRDSGSFPRWNDETGSTGYLIPKSLPSTPVVPPRPSYYEPVRQPSPVPEESEPPYLHIINDTNSWGRSTVPPSVPPIPPRATLSN